jgi:UDP:flavonoid glycosyltransferase YjiC (YdhE family)
VSCSVGGAGHLNPLRPFIDSLVQEGDEVLLIVPPSLEEHAAALGCPFRIGGEPGGEEVAHIREAIATAPRALAAVYSERELFGRLCTTAMLPEMQAAFSAWRPGLVLRETCEYASAVLAMRQGVPHAQVAISQGEIEAAALETAAPALEAHERGLVEQIRSSPYLTRFPASLDPVIYPDTRRFAEPVRSPGAGLPNWWDGDSRPLVYLTFGGVTGSLPIAAEVYDTALEAVRGLGLRVLLTLGNAFAPSQLGPVPPNVHLETWVPQDEVFREARLVVSHGGSGTSLGAVSAGLPQVVVPLFADQFANGRRIAEAGAGLCVEPTVAKGDERARLQPRDAPRLAAGISSVLDDPSYAAASARIAKEICTQVSLRRVLTGLCATPR